MKIHQVFVFLSVVAVGQATIRSLLSNISKTATGIYKCTTDLRNNNNSITNRDAYDLRLEVKNGKAQIWFLDDLRTRNANQQIPPSNIPQGNAQFQQPPIPFNPNMQQTNPQNLFTPANVANPAFQTGFTPIVAPNPPAPISNPIAITNPPNTVVPNYYPEPQTFLAPPAGAPPGYYPPIQTNSYAHPGPGYGPPQPFGYNHQPQYGGYYETHYSYPEPQPNYYPNSAYGWTPEPYPGNFPSQVYSHSNDFSTIPYSYDYPGSNRYDLADHGRPAVYHQQLASEFNGQAAVAATVDNGQGHIPYY